MRINYVLICLLLLASTGCSLGSRDNKAASPSAPSASSSATPAPAEWTDGEAIEQPDEIDVLISQMSLEQKIGQMIVAGIDGKAFNDAMNHLLVEYQVGGIILYKNNFSDLEGSVKLVNELKQANAGNAAPLIISVDQEGGKVSRLPQQFAAIPDAAVVGNTGNAELAEEMGSLLSKQLKLMGINVNYAPVLDINSNPKNPVIGARAFGDNAKLVTAMGLAQIKGLQQGGTIAVAKHFPGHGDTSVDSHLDLPVVNKTTEQLQKMEWLPFEAAIQEDVAAIMVAHILFPLIDADRPASLSKIIIGEQLRGTLGYDGVVITDDLTMGAIADHYGIADAAVLSVAAGSDLVLVAHGYDAIDKVYVQLLKSVQSGSISEARIDESIRRIIALKLKYQLSDQPVAIPTDKDLPNYAVRKWRDKLE